MEAHANVARFPKGVGVAGRHPIPSSIRRLARPPSIAYSRESSTVQTISLSSKRAVRAPNSMRAKGTDQLLRRRRRRRRERQKTPQETSSRRPHPT